MASIKIPAVYRRFTQSRATITVSGATVRAAFGELFTLFPGLATTMVDETAELRTFFNVYVNSENIRHLDGMETPLPADGEIIIIPAMAGGQATAMTDEALLTEAELQRYSRNILLAEVGVLGQRKLKEARVLLVGVGGLGSPAALYLAAAGVGTLGLVDADHVDMSNLQRQVLHTTADIGRPKVQSAQEHLAALNPHVQLIQHQEVLCAANARELIAGYDVVINGSDNFPTRYAVNDACVLLQKPLVDASILMWEAQATVFMPHKGCYRCLYPHTPPAGAVPSCGDAGVIGAMAGLVGTWQALEAVKIILGAGRVADDRLVIFNTLDGEVRTLQRRRNPSCAVCGDHPSITAPVDEAATCTLPADLPDLELAPRPATGPAAAPPAPQWRDVAGTELTAAEAAPYLGNPQIQWIDVREEHEYSELRIPGCTLIPMLEIPLRWQELDPARPTIVVCAVGQRSERVTQALRRAGFAQAYNLKGGLTQWTNARLPIESGDPNVPGTEAERV